MSISPYLTSCKAGAQTFFGVFPRFSTFCYFFVGELIVFLLASRQTGEFLNLLELAGFIFGRHKFRGRLSLSPFLRIGCAHADGRHVDAARSNLPRKQEPLPTKRETLSREKGYPPKRKQVRSKLLM